MKFRLWFVYLCTHTHKHTQHTHTCTHTHNTHITEFYEIMYSLQDNPAVYSFIFDTSRKRTCYIAPERFIDEQPTRSVDGDHADIFSLGYYISCIVCLCHEAWYSQVDKKNGLFIFNRALLKIRGVKSQAHIFSNIKYNCL